jgi:hypothetical protein
VTSASLGESDRVLHLSVAACHPAETDTEVDERPDQVRVLVSVTDALEHRDCAVGYATVELEEPLGDRTLIDASADRPLEVAQ